MFPAQAFSSSAGFLLTNAFWLVSGRPCNQSQRAYHGGRNKCKMASRIKPVAWLLFCDQQNYFPPVIRLKYRVWGSAEGWIRPCAGVGVTQRLRALWEKFNKQAGRFWAAAREVGPVGSRNDQQREPEPEPEYKREFYPETPAPGL